MTTFQELCTFMFDDASTAPEYFFWGWAERLEDGTLRVHDTEDDTVTDVTRERFIKGIDTFSETYQGSPNRFWSRFCHNWQAANHDAVDYDATITDAILQLAIHGEVVY